MIVIPSVNTARDVIARVPAIRPDTVVRASRVDVVPGGKPVNVAAMLGSAGIACHLVAVVDPETRAALVRTLASSVHAQFIEVGMALRTDIQLVDGDGRLMVANAPAGPGNEAGVEAALAATAAALRPDDVLLVAGSQPAGVTAALCQLAADRGARLAVDVSDEDLRAALRARPWLVKVTLDELAAVLDVSREAAWADGLPTARRRTTVVVTDGAQGARAWPADGRPFEMTPPATALVNPLGGGDAVMAGLLAGMVENADLVDALRSGVAWAADVVSRLEVRLDAQQAASGRDQVAFRYING